MRTIIFGRNGAEYTPDYFAVYTIKGGRTIKRSQPNLDESDLNRYDNVVKIQLFENGTETLAPKMIDQMLHKSNFQH